MELELANNIATDNHGVQAPVITTSHSTLDDGDEAGPAVVKKGAKRAATGPAAAGCVAGVPPRRAGVTPGPQAHNSVSIAAPPPKKARAKAPGRGVSADTGLENVLGVASAAAGSAPCTPGGLSAASGACPGTPFTPPSVNKGRGGAASVVDLTSGTSSVVPGTHALPSEESCDIQRVLMGAKLGRKLRSALLLFLQNSFKAYGVAIDLVFSDYEPLFERLGC